MPDISVTHDQKAVLRAILEWLSAGNKSSLTLGGYAGTGKSTLLSILRLILKTKRPNWRIAFAAYTGKATQVLEEKLWAAGSRLPKDSVSTLHSLLYAPLLAPSGEIVGWDRKKELEFDLIVVDEASMVTPDIWRDLLNFHVPVLAVGDHGQLPPVGEQFSLMANPDLVLTKIHRQAAESPIIQVATLARTTGAIPIKRFGNGVEKFDAQSPDAQPRIDDFFSNYQTGTLFLAGRNKTRVGINQAIRQSQWRNSEGPEVGDVVICLKNNRRKGIYNGMMGKIAGLEGVPNCDGGCNTLVAAIADFSGKSLYRGTIALDVFHQTEVDKTSFPKDVALFDYGYALTVHKAQGSQAGKVVVIEERNKHMTDEDWARWLYTAVTRAEKELYIFGSA